MTIFHTPIEQTLTPDLERLLKENGRLNEHCRDLSRQHHEALDENERLRTDAARYRWLRDADPAQCDIELIPTAQGEDLDRRIDSAIQAEPQEEKHGQTKG